jgi:hypothetical protein
VWCCVVWCGVVVRYVVCCVVSCVCEQLCERVKALNLRKKACLQYDVCMYIIHMYVCACIYCVYVE